jgi:hypothetical protein
MPIAPLLALTAIVCLARVEARFSQRRPIRPELPILVLGPALLIQLATAATVYTTEYQPVAYVDASGRPISYRMFFYGDRQRGFDQAIDFLKAHAQPAEVIAAGTPHWIHLRIGSTTVMPPLENDAVTAQALLDTVPVRYLVIGKDVVETERYTVPVVATFADRWTLLHSTPIGGWKVYRRVP